MDRFAGVAVAVAVVSVLIAGSPVAAASTPRSTCTPKHSRTIKQNRSIRVFSIRGHRADAIIYACLLARHRPMRLGSVSFDTGTASANPDDYLLAGTLMLQQVASCDRYYGPGDCLSKLRVRDLAARTTVAAFEVTGLGVRFVMDAAGRFAASIDRSGEAESPRMFEVRRFADGVSTLLDSGSGIDAQSLTRNGETVSWSNNDAAKSASLD